MEWLLALFLITSPLFFWAWAVIFFVIIMIFEENEQNFFAFISLGVFVALAVYSPVISIAFEPLTWLMWGAVYYAAGGLWSFIKWFSFLSKSADVFAEVKLKWLRYLNKTRAADEQLEINVKTKIPDDKIKGFKLSLYKTGSCYAHIAANNYSDDSKNLDDIIPLAGNHKEKIVTWILWWPTSALWTILNDPLLRLANWMYARFQGMYTRIANRIFAKFEIQ